MKKCEECKDAFDPECSIDTNCCDSCRMKMWPCLECGANDEYQADEKCKCNGDKDNCHASEHLL